GVRRNDAIHQARSRVDVPRRGRRTAVTDLTGRTALVTGAASGIGAATARAFATAGAKVVIADLDGDAAARLADELGGDAWQVDHQYTSALAELSLDVDILANNAGIQTVRPLE